MGRFILGVLFAVLAVWGYDRLFGSAANAGSSVQEGGAGQPFVDPGEPSSAELRRAEVVPPQAPTAVSDEGASFVALATAKGPERDALAAALHRRIRGAPSIDAALAVLGPDNSFVHSQEGRAAVEELADRIVAGEPWPAVRASSRLLEMAASGPIAAGQAEARSCLDRIRQRHDPLVRRTVFDPTDLTGARRYEIRAGENLTTIARSLSKSLGTPFHPGTLQLVNRIDNPNVIRPGQLIKVPVEPIRSVIWKGAFLVTVHVGDVIVRTYPCAHGKPGHETPETWFTIGPTTENPDWHYGGEVIAFGDPRNPLGSHFVQFQHESYSGFGIHGTNEPESIGTLASLGCIRLGVREIAEFASFVPRGSRVEVRR